MSSPEQSKGIGVGLAIASPLIVVVLILGLVVLVSGPDACADDGAGGGNSDTDTPGKTVDPDDIPVDNVGPYKKDQLVNAAIIMNAAADTNLSEHAQVLGVMAAIGESTLINTDQGDAAGPDSRGLFQQRGQGWGTEEERMDPYISATGFFGTGDHAEAPGLTDVDGWEDMEPTRAIHAVQANQNPDHYADFEQDARDIVDALADVDLSKQSGDSQFDALSATVAQDITAAGSGGGDYDKLYDELKDSLGAVKPHALEATAVVASVFDLDPAEIGGYRESARDPDGHPSGLAVDFMVPLDDEGKSLGDAISQYLIDNAESLNVDYVIWYQQIYHIDRGEWEDMSDRGSDTQNHKDHPHVNFTPESEGDPSEADDAPKAGGSTNPECETGEGGGNGDVNDDGWASPGDGPVTSPYGYRDHPVKGGRRLHAGTDLAAGGCGGPIWAANDGKVVAKGFDSGGNGYIKVDHGDKLATQYLHMYEDGMLVSVGDSVKAGDQIAETGSSGGSTGCHLHFEVLVDGEKTDPEPFMADKGITLGEQQGKE